MKARHRFFNEILPHLIVASETLWQTFENSGISKIEIDIFYDFPLSANAQITCYF